MRIVKASFEIKAALMSPKMLEEAGRTCYKSEAKITDDSADEFTDMLLKRGHMAMVEFGGWAWVKFICNRGISHEFVRHRIFSFAQESTRYCNYSKAKFGNQISVIDPRPFVTDAQFDNWVDDKEEAERRYFKRLELGEKAQMARGSLPIDLKTELNVAGNVREWRHFFSQRADQAAHPQARELACPLLKEFRDLVPILFDDVGDPDCV